MAGTLINHCQICGNEDLKTFFFAGYLPPVNTFRPSNEPLTQETFYPARLSHCEKCHLVQLGFEVDSTEVFPEDYAYRSGTTKLLDSNFADLAIEAFGMGLFTKGDMVIDCGSNDGTLLKHFKTAGAQVFGIEPTNAAHDAAVRGIPTFQGYLTKDLVKKVLDANRGRKAKIVTACNVFAHIPDVHEALCNILMLLEPDGVFISESHYLPRLFDTLQYDTVYHEHLRFYSLTSLKYLFHQFGLTIIHAKEIPTHGGSIRVYAKRSFGDSEATEPESVKRLLEEEWGHDSPSQLREFVSDITSAKFLLYSLLSSHMSLGPVVGIGCPSRAVTLIHYLGLDKGVLDYVCEVPGSPKIGKYVPGTIIPVVDEERLYREQPGLALLLSWHLADELIPKLRSKGYQGKFVVPLPVPMIRET